MKRRIISASIPMNTAQLDKASQLLKAYQAVFDILDDREFDEGGQFCLLQNDPNVITEIEDEIMYLGNLLK